MNAHGTDIPSGNRNYREVTITSGAGKSVKEWRSLLGGRGIRRHGKALVSGEKAIRDLLRLRPEIAGTAIIPIDWQANLPAIPDHGTVYRVGRELFRGT